MPWLYSGMMFLFTMLLTGCVSEKQPSALNPKGPAAQQVSTLSWIMFGAAAFVVIVVTILLLAAYRHRNNTVSQPLMAQPEDRRALTLVLVGGAVIPAIVLIILMGMSISIENAAAARNSSVRGPIIEVVGHQWWWEVNYPEQGITTANEIHIPVGKPVTLELSSADVIHSFWVPQLHPKLDVIPGHTNKLTIQADTAGTYRGECAEYCGVQHAHMQFLIIAQPQGEYDQWIAVQQQPALDPEAGSIEQEGQQVFTESACATCHTIQGTNAAGELGPDLTHIASRTTIGAGAIPNTRADLARWIMNSQTVKPGNSMPPMNLTSDQLEALLAYLLTLK